MSKKSKPDKITVRVKRKAHEAFEKEIEDSRTISGVLGLIDKKAEETVVETVEPVLAVEAVEPVPAVGTVVPVPAVEAVTESLDKSEKEKEKPLSGDVPDGVTAKLDNPAIAETTKTTTSADVEKEQKMSKVATDIKEDEKAKAAKDLCYKFILEGTGSKVMADEYHLRMYSTLRDNGPKVAAIFLASLQEELKKSLDPEIRRLDRIMNPPWYARIGHGALIGIGFVAVSLTAQAGVSYAEKKLAPPKGSKTVADNNPFGSLEASSRPLKAAK